MITEDYVSFETAKLLKEKGFDELCPTFYETDEPDNGPKYSNKLGWFLHISYDYSDRHGKMIISAPTLQMAMKWLREFHGLNIYARGVWKDVEVQYGDWEPAVVGYEWFVDSLIDDTYSKMSKEQFLTYEQACEAAVKYCLENLV